MRPMECESQDERPDPYEPKLGLGQSVDPQSCFDAGQPTALVRSCQKGYDI